MPFDRRKFRGRSSVNLGGLSSVLGDGGYSPVNPGDVPFDDETFDANTMTRFAPNSGFLNALSGGRASNAASALNAQQILSAQNLNNELAMQPKFDKLEIDKALAMNKAGYDAQVNRIASVLANEAEPEFLYSPEDEDIPPIFKSNARTNVANYGRGIETEGLLGAPSVVSARDASTDLTKAQTSVLNDKSDLGVHRPDGSIFYPKANVIMQQVPVDPLDPTKGTKWVRTDLSAVGLEKKPQSPPGGGAKPTIPQDKPGIVSSVTSALTPDEGNTAIIPSITRGLGEMGTQAYDDFGDDLYNMYQIPKYAIDYLRNKVTDSRVEPTPIVPVRRKNRPAPIQANKFLP